MDALDWGRIWKETRRGEDGAHRGGEDEAIRGGEDKAIKGGEERGEGETTTLYDTVQLIYRSLSWPLEEPLLRRKLLHCMKSSFFLLQYRGIQFTYSTHLCLSFWTDILICRYKRSLWLHSNNWIPGFWSWNRHACKFFCKLKLTQQILVNHQHISDRLNLLNCVRRWAILELRVSFYRYVGNFGKWLYR